MNERPKLAGAEVILNVHNWVFPAAKLPVA
jgi:hypothetical protein